MTRILGIDPGATTGWCEYDTDARCVRESGQFCEAELDDPEHGIVDTTADIIVIERPVGYGPTRPQLVDCGWIAGRIFERFDSAYDNVQTLTRRDVKQILTAATQRDIVVKDDASAWAALKLLHTENADVPLPDKKGGALYGVKAHGRAALAVAVAFALKQAKAEEQTPHYDRGQIGGA